MASDTVKKVVGLGDPVMDICCDIPSDLLEGIGAQPGGCMLVSPLEMQSLLDTTAAQAPATRVPGGSAANVMKGLAGVSCGTLRTQFMGMVGADEAGTFYTEQLLERGVEPLLLESTTGAPTARCVCLVTPDGQRTMRTCLGAAAELTSCSQLPQGWNAGPALLHCEGYLLYKPIVVREAMAAARAAGALVSLDLASFEVVAACRDTLLGLLEAGLVDVVFANEEEAAALAGGAAAARADGQSTLFLVEAAQSLVLQHARVCVVSLGARGAVARAASGEAGSAAASKVAVVDTIGAGDLFSAGFLYALLRGSPLSTCCAAWRRLRATIAGLVGDNAMGVAEGRPPPGSARALICPPGRKHRSVYGQQGSVGHSPGLERSRTGSLASSMTSSSSTQWLGMEADS